MPFKTTPLLTFRFIILLAFFLPVIVFGQKKNKYKYKYREHLEAQSSTFTIQLIDTVLKEEKCNLTFILLDKKGEAVYGNIKIKSSKIDTTIQSDFEGYATVKLPLDTFSISLSSFSLTPLKLDTLVTKANKKILIKTSLGKSNYNAIALIYSVRKLSEIELNKIIYDLTNDNDDNELIKNKTCYVMWEI